MIPLMKKQQKVSDQKIAALTEERDQLQKDCKEFKKKAREADLIMEELHERRQSEILTDEAPVPKKSPKNSKQSKAIISCSPYSHRDRR